MATNILNHSRKGMQLLPTLGDGHCLLHAVIGSWKLQMQSHILCPSLHSLKCDIFKESLNNREHYLSFISSRSHSNYDFMHSVKEYLLQKRYNNDYGDIIPAVIANALSLTIKILDVNDDGSLQEVVIKPRLPNSSGEILIHRQQEHYSSLRPNFESADLPLRKGSNKVEGIKKYSAYKLLALTN